MNIDLFKLQEVSQIIFLEILVVGVLLKATNYFVNKRNEREYKKNKPLYDDNFDDYLESELNVRKIKIIDDREDEDFINLN